MKNGLTKGERLTGKDKIENLYRKGRHITEFPIKVIWLDKELEPGEPPARIVFSVPKRKFKRAIKRNKIRRLCKEAFRQNKQEFYSQLQHNNKQVWLFMIYLSDEIPTHKNISQKIIVLLNRLIQEITENENNGKKV